MAMQAIPEQFSLRWNDFYTNLSTSFQAFLAAKDLVDVTLAADGQYVHAHKLILSICSPYFKELFKNNPCEHPIVFLKDVTQHELQQLLQFMYRGEVHVRQQELSGFLHTAEMLQVKGLTGGGRERSESPPTIPDEPPLDSKVQQPLEHSMDSMKDWDIGCDDVVSDSAEPSTSPAEITENKSPLRRLLKNTHPKNNYKVKKEPQRTAKDGLTENSDYPSDYEPTLTEFDTEEQMLHHHSVLVVPKKEGWNCKTAGAKCPSCHRIFANRYNLKVHIRDKHDTREGTLQCEICQKRMRNPSCLRVHMYHHRKQAAYMAQLASPNDMTRIVHGMVGMKQAWRSDMPPVMPELVDMENKTNSVAGMKPGWRSEMAPGIADLSEIENKAAALAGLSKLKQGLLSDLAASLNDVNDEKMMQGLDCKTEIVDDNMQGKKKTWRGADLSPDQENVDESVPSSTPAAQSPYFRDDMEAMVDDEKNASE